MNKQAFLEELNRLTGALSEQERARLADYYGEMIDDRVEEGLSEEEAVAALGDPAALARELTGLAAAPKSALEGDASQTVEALSGLRVRVYNADVKLRREPLSNGAAAQLRFSDPARFEWRMEGEALVIAERRTEAPRLSLAYIHQLISSPNLTATLILADALPGDLEVATGGGDVSLEDVTLGGSASLDSASGDICLSSTTCAGLEIGCRSGDVKLKDVNAAGLRVHTSSGDIDASGLSVSGAARLETASGDMELRDLHCGELTLSAASGDIEIDRGTAGAASIRAASGDVRLDELETDPTLQVETANGDIDLTRCIARQTRLKAASGDVKLRLEPLPCGYDISATSASGSIRFDDSCQKSTGADQPRITIQTVSGDIEAKVMQ